MTYEQAMQSIYARSTIEVKHDRKGRSFAQYYSMRAMRWIRMPLADAELILAQR